MNRNDDSIQIKSKDIAEKDKDISEKGAVMQITKLNLLISRLP